jgi:hypothetical protein
MCKTSRTFVDYILHGCGIQNNQWNHPKKLVLHKIEDVESFLGKIVNVLLEILKVVNLFLECLKL